MCTSSKAIRMWLDTEAGEWRETQRVTQHAKSTGGVSRKNTVDTQKLGDDCKRRFVRTSKNTNTEHTRTEHKCSTHRQERERWGRRIDREQTAPSTWTTWDTKSVEEDKVVTDISQPSTGSAPVQLG